MNGLQQIQVVASSGDSSCWASIIEDASGTASQRAKTEPIGRSNGSL
jgi:hypothetical protein